MTEKLSEIVTTLSQLLTTRDFQALRQTALKSLCDICNAPSGFLFMDDQSIVEHGEKFQTSCIELAGRFLNSQSSVEEKDGLVLSRISLGDETYGVAVLRTSHRCSNAIVMTFLALAEQNQRIRKLLDLTQEGLRNLSQESAAIAENNSRLFQKMIANESHLRSISRGILRMQEEERSKISREMHDGIGQALTALKMNMDILANEIEGDLSPQSIERFHEVKVLAENSLEDVRELSRLLRPRILDDLGLFPTLRWYVRRFGERTGIAVKLQLQDTEQRLDPEIETMLFRITQEALNNIAKHSQSPTASVTLELKPKEIELEIQDQGVGFDVKENHIKTSGLSGMRDRVSLWSGTLAIQSVAGSGTTLRVTVPVKHLSKSKKARRG
jgi:two-component system NarL family sensor kinase